MDSVVIVALPSLRDPVYKYSSEKVPHLTMLFLGEVEPEPLMQIMEFVQHAAKGFHNFGLSVDRRGTLGPDDADVLFFENEDKYSMGRLKEFRAQLLQNEAINRAYLSTEQYPEWTPHLTMGYPESPAKEDEREYPGFDYVSFDRLAVWVGDSEGPEFDLRDYEDTMEVSMSTSQAGAVLAAHIFEDYDALEHYGKKGMKWGVTTVDKASKATKTQDTPPKRPARDVVVSQPRPGDYAKAKGGQRNPATEDAVKAVAGRQKAKKSTTDALTNDELQTTIKRMELENKFIKLDKENKRLSRGRRLAEKILLLKKDFDEGVNQGSKDKKK